MEEQLTSITESNLPSVVLPSDGVCKFWLSGFCKAGIDCPMQHPEDNNSTFFNVNSSGNSISLVATSATETEDQDDLESEQSDLALRPSSVAASTSSSTISSSNTSPTSISPSPHTDACNDTDSSALANPVRSTDPQDETDGAEPIDDETASNASELSAKDIAVGAGADESKIQAILAGLKAPSSEALMSMIASTDKWVTSVVRVHQRLRTALHDGEEDPEEEEQGEETNLTNNSGRPNRSKQSRNDNPNRQQQQQQSSRQSVGTGKRSSGSSPAFNESARRRGSGGNSSRAQPNCNSGGRASRGSGVGAASNGNTPPSIGSTGGPVKLSDRPPTSETAPKVFVTRSQKTVVKKDRTSASSVITPAAPSSSSRDVVPTSSSTTITITNIPTSSVSAPPPICQNIRFGISCRPDCPFTHPPTTGGAPAISGLVVTRTGDSRSVRPITSAPSTATTSVSTPPSPAEPTPSDTSATRTKRVIVVKKKE